MKAIITIFGKDKVGIIASVSALLAKNNVNILDITQTVMREYFTMTMLVDLAGLEREFIMLQDELTKKGQELQMDIRIQREDIFEKMYEI
ncbi:MAG: ACT domain-containing protein [Tissierellia bacterium]|nr:ACT domain-containing protein [Tissierellia bacterium]